MHPTSMNNCPSTRTQCIIRNTDYGQDHYLLLTDEQIRMVNHLIHENIIDSDIFMFIVLDGSLNSKFEEV